MGRAKSLPVLCAIASPRAGGHRRVERALCERLAVVLSGGCAHAQADHQRPIYGRANDEIDRLDQRHGVGEVLGTSPA